MDKRILLLLVTVVLINAIANGMFQLHYDETYYWTWSQNLGLSYFDHPPMVAYMIWLCTRFSHAEFFVRLPALICTFVTIIMIFKLANRMFSLRVANIATVLAISWPMLEGAFFIVTPDSPLLMLWALALYAAYVGVFESRTKYIYLAGLWAGCAMLSKYTGGFVFVGLLLFLLFSPKYRQLLARKDVYLAFILGLIVFSPVLIWNYTHDWISIIFQMHHGLNDVRELHFDSFFDFIGAQLLANGPFITLAIAYYILRYVKVNCCDERLRFLFWPFICVILFFAYSGLYAQTGANWPEPAYISGIIMLSYWLDKYNNRWVYRASLVLILIALAVVKLPMLLIPTALSERVSALNAFFGTAELMHEVKPYITKDTVVIGCDYANASRAWYYLDLPQVYVLDNFRYVNTYRYWNNDLAMPIKRAIFICEINDPIDIDILRGYFAHVDLVSVPEFKNKIAQSKIYIFQATN